MKSLIFCFIFLMTSAVLADSKKIGVGFMLGNPTGLSGKYLLGNEKAVDAGLAYSVGKNVDVSLHSDYLLNKKAALYFNDTQPLDLYYGIGARMEFSDDMELGMRLPVGLSHDLNDGDAELFGEVAPILDIIGRIGIEMHLAIGGRYYF